MVEKGLFSSKTRQSYIKHPSDSKIQYWADETENPRLQFWARYLPARNAFLNDIFDNSTFYEALFLAQQHQLQPELALAQLLLAGLFQSKEIFNLAFEYAQKALPVCKPPPKP
ncbi:MAG: hypothetical protein HC913_17705 [Microscillaceae bacterium]|nr:hypothetical protein [Microscillaceae bacterium]